MRSLCCAENGEKSKDMIHFPVCHLNNLQPAPPLTMMRTYAYLLISLCQLPFLLVDALQGTPTNPVPKRDGLTKKIQVCQEPQCCQRFKESISLVQTIRHLSDKPLHVEPTGCMPECCEQGANVRIVDSTKDGNTISMSIHHGINSADAAAAFMEKELGISVHPTLLSANNDLQLALQAESTEEKLQYLNSAIQTLSGDEKLENSNVMAHALTLKAEQTKDPSDVQLAAAKLLVTHSLKFYGVPEPSKLW